MPLDDPQHLTRSAEVRVNSFDPETRTFSAVIATAHAVTRHDAQGPYLEILPPDAFDLVAQNLPVLDSHNTRTVRAVLGRTVSIRRVDAAIEADMRLSSAEDVAPVGQRIADGTLSGVSIGYRVAGWTLGKRGAMRTKTAKRITLSEVTLTSNPADPNAAVRHQEEADVPKDTQTTDRAALIQRVRAAHNLPEEWATRMEEAGEELTDDDVRESGREEAVTARATRTAPTIRTAAPQNEDPAVIATRQTEALACRMAGDAPSDEARAYMGLGLEDLARDALTRAGERVGMMGREELMTRAMHGTSDFPELLTGAGNRVLTNAYQRAESVLKTLARQRTASDFRALSILKVAEFSGLQKVSEHGEIKAMTTGETKEGYSLETFGGMFSLTRKAIINDDLGAFGRWAEMMGSAAAETEAAQLIGLLTANSGGGVKLSDGKNLFHADHGNLSSTGDGLGDVGVQATLDAARLAMRTQKGLDGKTPVNVRPKYLLVGPESESAAEKLLASIYPATTDDVNVYATKLSLLVEPRITGPQWWVFGDPATAPVLEYAYLSSAPGPQLASRDGWETLGREFRVVLDFGCGAVDHRGAYRNAGA
ncbi:prohead protease/major capsid protein fusion protein [Mameliella sediminis]|uniref:prohead protease/major capsid protein fusion protein n=1 Tax=Mameliella sediminis TaxID=2836866 RepID=UPI001C48845B|nr:prohead protease/major capsid protein fusion protein [Mameliella sediminis]MBV7394648.1 Mu-like prophage major head subunit gpT family protein [Mameliella sediminis]